MPAFCAPFPWSGLKLNLTGSVSLLISTTGYWAGKPPACTERQQTFAEVPTCHPGEAEECTQFRRLPLSSIR
jgi:hypothetical protein